MKYAALALLFAAATPAYAQDFSFSTFRNELNSGALDTAPGLTPEPDFFQSVRLAGGLEMRPDRMTMEGLSKIFGVVQQTYQHVGYTTTWLCFSHAGRRLWFLADETYETRKEAYVSTIIDEPADPATDALFLCGDDPKAMLGKQDVLPTIGATLAELNAFYKATMPLGTTYLSAYADDGDDESGHDSRLVYYRLKDGVVDAISISGGAVIE